MAKRLNSMPLVINQDDAALAMVRPDATSQPTRSAPNNARKTPLRTSQTLNGLGQNSRSQNGHSNNGQSHNGHSYNGHGQNSHDHNGHSRNGRGQNGQRLETDIADDVRGLIRDHRLDVANRIVAGLLDQRIADGDSALGAVSMLLQHYDIILSRQPPLSHIGAVPLRPNESLYACFDKFIDLIRQQQNQVSELQAIIAELI